MHLRQPMRVILRKPQLQEARLHLLERNKQPWLMRPISLELSKDGMELA